MNALGVYADSSKDPFDDPKIETIAEIFWRRIGGGIGKREPNNLLRGTGLISAFPHRIGIVSTAFIADATPAALTAHTRDRGQYGHVVDTYIHGITNYTWTNWTGPDVLFGGGAEQFYPGMGSYQGKDYYKVFANAGYNVVWNNTAMQKTANDTKTLGIFCVSNMVNEPEP